MARLPADEPSEYSTMQRDATGNNFDIIRFAFASLVVFSHSYPLATGTEDYEPLKLLSHGQLTLGTLAVDCFFIISGYLISQSWERKPRVAAFLAKRVRRIYPGFLVAATVSAFVVTPLFMDGGSPHPVTPTLDFVFKALRLIFVQPAASFQHNPAAGVVNGSLWSIPFEFWCYVGLMAVGLLGLLKRPGWLAAGLAFLIVESFVFEWRNLRIGGKILGVIFGYPNIWAHILPYFVAGMVFHAFNDRVRYTGRGALAAIVLTLIACAIPYAILFVLPVTAAYLVLWLAFIPTRRIRHFARQGDYSFGIYLYAFPISQMVAHFTGPTSPWMLFLMAWPLSIAAGALSWHLVEHRFVRAPVLKPALAR